MQKKEYSIFKESKLSYLKFPPPFKGQSFFNDELRIVFVIKGNSTYYTPNGSTNLKTGDLIVFNNDNFINRWEASTDECLLLIFRITPELLKEIYKPDNSNLIVTKKQQSYIVFSFKMIKYYFTGFKKYLDKPNYVTEELLMIKLKELLYILSQKKSFTYFMQQINFNAIKNNTHFRNTIFSNIYNPINIEELSFLCNMSLSTFQRNFKKVYKTTPTKYIESQRMKKARLLLAESEDSISNICYQIGYTSLSHFSKKFKKEHTISPSTYRKNIKKNNA